MQKYSLKDVRVTNGFFFDLINLNRSTTIYSVYDQFARTGRFDAIKLKKVDGAHIFWDSDVAKWLESAIYIIYSNDDPTLKKRYEDIVTSLITSQREDGYFNSYFMVYEPNEIFKRRHDHELYCAGHLFEAAHAASFYLKDDRLLHFSRKYCEFIKKCFIEKKTASFVTPGHEEIELALYKLYSLTKDELYKELFDFFLENRGKQVDQDHPCFEQDYHQSHLPITKQNKAEGHSVRALYLYSAMSDYAALHNDNVIEENCKSLFNDIISHKMYVTGGVGSTYCGESFTFSYDLPNDKAYTETCAAIALTLFSQRQIANTCSYDPSYGRAIEKNIYNSIISGLSLDGKCFFYTNPLELHYDKIKYYEPRKTREGQPISKRVEYFFCSCCPPNVTRLIEQIPTLIYYKDENSIIIDQLISSHLKTSDNDLEIDSSFPYGGDVKIKVHHCSVKKLVVRLPEWVTSYSVDTKYLVKNGCLEFDVKDEQEINLSFALEVRIISCDPRAKDNAHKVCFSYGPFILCAEQCDNPDINLFGVKVIPNVLKKEQKDGILLLTMECEEEENPGKKLYYYEDNRVRKKRIILKPYYQWANSLEGNMVVWFHK